MTLLSQTPKFSVFNLLELWVKRDPDGYTKDLIGYTYKVHTLTLYFPLFLLKGRSLSPSEVGCFIQCRSLM